MLKAFAVVAAAAALGYGALVHYARLQFGRTKSRWPDALFDSLLPLYDVQEQHQIRIAAPVHVTWATAQAMNLDQLAIVRLLVRIRSLAMGKLPQPPDPAGGLIDASKKIGWGWLAEEPEHEVLMGAVTQPWHGKVIFRPLSPEAFVAFRDPNFVKIAWNLRVDADGAGSILRTETRVQPTDDEARGRFRRYWSFIFPGVVLIRFALLREIKNRSERPRG
ncbi:MAG: hypothetical protein WDO18_02100 [Acidobacteriota bacterium]